MISVVIPIYNSESTIIKALESVRKQNYMEGLEIIIVNDGSMDNSVDIVKQYKLKYDDMNIKIINKKNGGVAYARNAGIRESNGEFIALLDSDDEWLSNKLSVIMPYFNNSKIDCIGSARDGKIIKIGFKSIKELTKIQPNDLVFRWNPQTSTVIFRKSIIDKIGLYNENMRYAEDCEYWLRIAQHCGFYCIPNSLVMTGNGKHYYGQSGLSGNLSAMHRGELHAISVIFTRRGISLPIYFFAKLFARLKYIKRIIVVKLRK
jgi:glycosyltransferase involved in cell wall biosynthesis